MLHARLETLEARGKTAKLIAIECKMAGLVTAADTIKVGSCRAFAYNIVLIPAALLSPLVPFLQGNAPIFAAAAMALSSVTVVSNSVCLVPEIMVRPSWPVDSAG